MIRLGFVGCGGIQKVHYDCLCTFEDIELAGHCDVDEACAQEAAARFGGRAFTDHRAMYDAVKPHAVYVAVPPFAHGDIEMDAAERGIHLFVEKPIALERHTAKRIASAIRKAGVLCGVAYCFRYADTTAVARKQLKGKAPSLITGLRTGGIPTTRWWRQMDKSGGQIIEQTTHLVDLMRYLCGDVAEVYATGSTGCLNHLKDFDVYDSSVLTMRMKSGATASLASSCVADYNERTALDIVTPEGSIHFANGRLTVREDGQIIQYLPKADMYYEENIVFIDAVRTGKRTKLRCSYADALKTFLVTAAANESIVSGLPVRV